MSILTAELVKDIDQGKDALRTLRDEIRLKIHLGKMEAKGEWRALEPRIANVEAAADRATEATRNALDEAVKELEAFATSLV